MGLTRLEALQILGLEEGSARAAAPIDRLACRCVDFEPIISAGCSEKEIRDRFKKLALKWHPDKNFHNPDEAQKVINYV